MMVTDQGAEKVDSFQDEFLMSYSGDAQLFQFLVSDVQQLLSSHLLSLKILHILLETVIQTWWDDRKMRVRTPLAFLCGHCQSGIWVNYPPAHSCFPGKNSGTTTFSADILLFILSVLVQNYIWRVFTLLTNMKICCSSAALGLRAVRCEAGHFKSCSTFSQLAFGIFPCVNIAFFHEFFDNSLFYYCYVSLLMRTNEKWNRKLEFVEKVENHVFWLGFHRSYCCHTGRQTKAD